jgi:flagellin
MSRIQLPQYTETPVMVTSVNTNVNAMAAIQSLNMISSQMTSTQSAIESGLKVNSAADNPAVFTIAQGLRANVGALSAVSSNLSTAVATIQGQTQGATSISNTLNTLLQTVTQGLSETDPNAIATTNANITNALNDIDAFAKASTINGVNLLSGSGGTFSVVSNVDGTTTSVSTSAIGGSTAAGLGLTGLSLTTGGTTLSTNSTAIATGDTVTYTNGANSTVFEFNDGTAALTSVPSATQTVVAVNMTNAGGTANTDSQNMGALLAAMQANGVAGSEDSNGMITVTGAGTTTASALTTGTVSGGASAINAVNAAITQIGKVLSALGSTTIQLQGLQDFTTQLSDSVTTGLGAMVDANLSAESAQLSSLQTKQSLAIQSLTLANQGPSSLLQLFR